MTTRPFQLFTVTMGLLIATANVGFALTAPPDKGKERLLTLFVDVVSPVLDSVVRVQSDGKDAYLGTIVSENGYILTKGSELRGELSCVLRDGTSYDAKRVGYHKPSDLVLLKIDTDSLKPISFAKEDIGIVGNWVAVPGIKSSEPIAVGVVSAPARKLYGEQALIMNVNKGYLGISNLMNAEDEGVIIKDVRPDTAASRAGIKVNDIISEVAGQTIRDREALFEVLDGFKPNETITVRVKRGANELSLKVKLGELAEFDRGAFQNNMGGALSGRRTGFPAVIQHDTILKPTDCGGPLVDLEGHVLGINIARAGRVESWTIPGSVVKPILKDLIAGKYSNIIK